MKDFLLNFVNLKCISLLLLSQNPAILFHILRLARNAFPQSLLHEDIVRDHFQFAVCVILLYFAISYIITFYLLHSVYVFEEINIAHKIYYTFDSN